MRSMLCECAGVCYLATCCCEEIPYAAIYNREPGIPLSLGAPRLELARFTMSAGTIVVDFDRPTNRRHTSSNFSCVCMRKRSLLTRGALPVYISNPLIPDFYDNTTIGIGWLTKQM
eukprot:859956-Amphidinium_carterae.2